MGWNNLSHNINANVTVNKGKGKNIIEWENCPILNSFFVMNSIMGDGSPNVEDLSIRLDTLIKKLICLNLKISA